MRLPVTHAPVSQAPARPAATMPPPAADLFGILGADADETVRILLVRKLCRLLPTLPADGIHQVYQATLQALEALACDQAVTVRAALATALRDVECAPPAMCRRLAWDVEQAVAEPILHYCLTLTDADLLEIIVHQPTIWALLAIAGRERVSASVATALTATGNADVIAALLQNHGATLTEPTLTQVVDWAPHYPGWHMPLARRPHMPQRLAQRLAEFVDETTRNELLFRHHLGDEATRDVLTTARRRIAWWNAPSTHAGSREPPAARARRLHATHQLDDAAISDALSWGQTEFVITALALLAGCTPDLAARVLNAQSPRGVTALAWKAGLSMRTAIKLQTQAARIPARRLLNARFGTDYPLSEIEMLWHLEFFGVPTGV